jgi:RNA polymerase sigma factor (TIGR02999 family)
MSEVTLLLSAIDQGDPAAAAHLLPLVYEELRALAARRLARESAAQTWQPTALVHEAYIRLVAVDPDRPWNGRRHFFAAAAEAMRRILIDRARHKQTLKAGGGRQPVDVAEIDPPAPEPGVDLLALDEVLEKFEQKDRRKAELVKLRFFVGLTIEQAAEILGVSTTTADKDWAYARAWLRAELGGDAADTSQR